MGRLFGHHPPNYCEDLNELHSDALKMLAAAAACERYRAERSTT